MFERFTDRARKVMAMSNLEAKRLNHEYLGTEHILLGLVREGSGVGVNVLRAMNVDLDAVRMQVEKLIKAGPEMVSMGKLPQTPRAKKVIEEAINAARELGHNYVGTEHLLLGLIRERDGVAAHALAWVGVTQEVAQETVTTVLKSARPDSGEPIANPQPLASKVDPGGAVRSAADIRAAEFAEFFRRLSALEADAVTVQLFARLLKVLIAWLAALSVIVLALVIFIALRSR
jgi:ATP-dependent Clp protease ATP-binding subunit ClpC